MKSSRDGEGDGLGVGINESGVAGVGWGLRRKEAKDLNRGSS